MESTAQDTLDTPAEIPFPHKFHDDDADLTVRSCDGIEFRVYKVILARASTVFKDMCTIPARNNHESEPPLIEVTEDGPTIAMLFALCYPDADPDVTDLDELSRLVEACDKYGMEGPKKRLGNILRRHAQERPLRVFAIAHRVGLEDVVKQAALQCLRRPNSDLEDVEVPELGHLSALTYRALLRYYRRCTKVALEVINDTEKMTWILSSAKNFSWFQCRACEPHTHIARLAGGALTYVPRKWWINHMRIVATAAANSPPLAFHVSEHLSEKSIPANMTCATCGPSYWKDMVEFIPMFEREIERVIGTIPLNLDC